MRRTITKSTWAEIRTFYASGLGVREIAIGYAKFFGRSHHAVIRVYDKAANVIETHEHTGDLPRKLSERQGNKQATDPAKRRNPLRFFSCGSVAPNNAQMT